MKLLSSTDIDLLVQKDPQGADSPYSIGFHSFLYVPPDYGSVLIDEDDVFYLGFSNASPIAYLVRQVGTGDLAKVFPFLRSINISELFFRSYDSSNIVLTVPANTKPKFSDVWDFIFHNALVNEDVYISRISVPQDSYSDLTK